MTNNCDRESVMMWKVSEHSLSSALGKLVLQDRAEAMATLSSTSTEIDAEVHGFFAEQLAKGLLVIFPFRSSSTSRD